MKNSLLCRCYFCMGGGRPATKTTKSLYLHPSCFSCLSHSISLPLLLTDFPCDAAATAGGGQQFAVTQPFITQPTQPVGDCFIVYVHVGIFMKGNSLIMHRLYILQFQLHCSSMYVYHTLQHECMYLTVCRSSLPME